QESILWDIRLPRVVLAALVGAMLSLAGASYQGVFRNPLADPYLLGVAAGAGLGATSAVVIGVTNSVEGGATGSGLLAVFAFVGALVAVVLTYSMGMAGERVRTPSALILAGVAVTAFL